MINKKNLPIVILVLATGSFVAFKTLAFNGNPPTKYELILQNVGKMLEDNHYSPKNINDNFSIEVFKKYLAEVDPEKDVLLQSDITGLKKYETRIDDEILGKSSVQFVPAVNLVYNKRIAETEVIYKEILATPFDFSKDERLVWTMIK